MRSVNSLIKLDFYTLKPLFGMIAGGIILSIIIGIITQPTTLIMMILTFIAFMLNICFSIGEKSNFNKLYGVLPVKKSEVVIGKYLFSFLIICVLSIIAFLLFVFLSLFVKKNIDWLSGISFLSASFAIATIFISIQFPFYFKLEYSKAAFISVLPYIIFFAIGSPLVSYLMGNEWYFSIWMKIVSYFKNHVYMIGVTGIGVGILFLIISCMVSIALTKKKK